MKGEDLVRFALGGLRGHPLRAGLSLLGVAIGVASVIVLTSLGQGARDYVTGEFASLGTNLLIVLPGKTTTTGMLPAIGGTTHDLTLADAEAIRRGVRAVRYVAPIGIGTAPVRYGSRSRDATVFGTTWEMEPVRRFHVAFGRYLPSGEAERAQSVCVLGARIRTELFGAANPVGEVLRVGDERFRVIGVMAPRGQGLGFNFDEVVHVPIARNMKMFNRRSIFRMLVEVSSRDEMEAVKESIVRLVKERHEGEEDITVLTQDALLSTFGKILDVLTAALSGIAAISLSVAGILIMNVMLVSVSERTREIGLLKAVGAGSGQVLSVFLAEAALLSTAGGVAGLAVGIGAARLVSAASPGFTASAPPWAVAAALVVSAGVGLAFGALPARRAARLDPVAALARR
ncbi:MAG TPA: ABC transporter permease [Thermoanaerobaculia bacterium]|nr:ABC transporter permease [Thermoanaerobaculia bacterium]